MYNISRKQIGLKSIFRPENALRQTLMMKNRPIHQFGFAVAAVFVAVAVVGWCLAALQACYLMAEASKMALFGQEGVEGFQYCLHLKENTKKALVSSSNRIVRSQNQSK